MGEVRQTFRAAALSAESPAMVLHHANAILNLREPPVMVTAIFGLFDPLASTVTYATAGHPPPILASADGLVQVLPFQGIPLGISNEVGSTDFTFSLPPGSLLALYTDGLIEHARDLITGEAALVEAVALEAASPSSDPASALQRRIFHDGIGNMDDVATLTLTLADRPLNRMSFVFSAIPLAAKLARHGLRRLARELGLSAEKSFALVTAVGEAVANAVEHAYAYEQPGILLINVHCEGDGLFVEIEDRGCWRKSPKREERGRGLPLMRALADSVQIHSNRSGTVVKLVLSL
jgi:anti-sigma regulatory factor (Ser/Thr protein kinase)